MVQLPWLIMMLLDREKIYDGHYMGLEKWLAQHFMCADIDYHFKYEPIPHRTECAYLSEIVFVDPKMETLALLRWS